MKWYAWLAVLLLGCGRLSVRENWWLFFQLIFWSSAFVLREMWGVNLASIKWWIVLQLNKLLVAGYKHAKLFIIVAVGSSDLRHISWSYRCTTPWMLSTPACSRFTTNTTICMNMAKPFFHAPSSDLSAPPLFQHNALWHGISVRLQEPASMPRLPVGLTFSGAVTSLCPSNLAHLLSIGPKQRNFVTAAINCLWI